MREIHVLGPLTTVTTLGKYIFKTGFRVRMSCDILWNEFVWSLVLARLFL